MNNKFTYFDDLDIFLVRAQWSHKKHEKYFVIRENILNEVSAILDKSDIDYFFSLDKKKFEEFLVKKNMYDILFLKPQISFEKITRLFEKHSFKFIESSSNFYLFKNNILIKISYHKNSKEWKNIKQHYLNNQQTNFALGPSNFNLLFNSFKNKISKFKKIFLKKYYIFKFLGIKNSINFDPKVKYEISLKKFLKLKIESVDSINWNLRSQHLNLITQNKKNIKIFEIIEFFKVEENFKRIKGKVIDSNLSNLIEEPVHLSRGFWDLGNNYFINPIIYEFKKNVLPYKKSNEYIANKDMNILFSQKYYEGLDDMSDNEIEEFLKENPIEITKDYLTSGRHRVCAMIGRLVNNKKYISIYAVFK